MAELTDGPGPGMASARAGVFVQYVGGAVSLALVAGVAVWGYKLLVRDATGIPVVRAMEGPLREAPRDPGGEIAPHVGLAVNAVAALGTATPTEDVLLLAPATAGLTEEDLLVQPTTEADEYLPEEEEPVLAAAAAPSVEPQQPGAVEAIVPPEGPLSAEDVLALADLIAGGAAPLADLAPVEPTPDAVAEPAAVADAGGGLIASSVPGVARALRPPARPATLVTVAAAAPGPAATPQAGTPAIPITTTEPPEGTPLVQLGAFPSAEVARAEWTRVAGTFADFVAGKDPFIQEAVSNGRTFFRLRALGFADLAEARRFCSALVAEQAECIPLVVR